MEKFKCGRFELDFKTPKIMGIVNLTPDSFSGDGIFQNPKAALNYAQKQIQNGADVLDIGAQSSRPFAKTLDFKEEWARLEPVLKEVVGWGVPISVDSFHPEIIENALNLGVDFINDILGLKNQETRAILKKSQCAICLMHMQNLPPTMQLNPVYPNVVEEVMGFFKAQKKLCREEGIDSKRIIFDPGFGFGKNLEHNVALFHALPQFSKEFPVLIGVSKKKMLGEILKNPAAKRVVASVAAALKSLSFGVKMVRVHDVLETKEAFLIWEALSSTVKESFFSK